MTTKASNVTHDVTENIKEFGMEKKKVVLQTYEGFCKTGDGQKINSLINQRKWDEAAKTLYMAGLIAGLSFSVQQMNRHLRGNKHTQEKW